MATYMVEVNNKFMVRLEIEGSACAAEHYFLDRFHGVWGALAYDQKAMKTDCFIGAMMHDELTTVDELTDKLYDLEDHNKELESIVTNIENLKSTIENYQKELENQEAIYNEELVKWGTLNKELNATRPQ